MKKIYSFIIMCVFPLMAFAQGNVQVDGLKYSLGDNQTAEVVGCDAGVADIIIPKTIVNDGKDYSVTSIMDEAFKKNAGVKTVIIGANVEHIGLSAFEECTHLGTVTFEEGSRLAVISSSAFATCTGLNKINFAADGALGSIANSAFTACSSLTDINFPSSLKSIDFYAFGECSALKEITFDANSQLNNIEPFAFNSCGKLAVINLPASLTSIGDMAFTSCKSLSVINSAISEPFSIGEAFDYGSKQTLYVPTGTKSKYQSVSGWKRFKNIEEKDMGIDDVRVSEDNAAVYDLQGRRVENPSKGLYIKGGKKIVLK